MPFDQTVFAVVPDQDDAGHACPHDGLHFLGVHQKAGVAGDRHGFAVRIGELGGENAGHRDAHRGEAVRDDAGIGAFGLIHPRHPHLVRADVGNDDVFRGERLAQIPDDFLRAHRKAHIVLVGAEFIDDRLAQRGGEFFVVRFGFCSDGVKRSADIADHPAFQNIVLVHFGRAHVDMDDLFVLGPMPQIGGGIRRYRSRRRSPRRRDRNRMAT